MKTLHVAVGIIYNQKRQILIAKRDKHKYQGGLWEFPGGKVETGETIRQALDRQLNQEIGIQVTAASPLMQVNHNYDEKQILLDVWQVTDFTGVAQGNEGQAVRWIDSEEFVNYQFPEANQGIIEKIKSTIPVTTN